MTALRSMKLTLVSYMLPSEGQIPLGLLTLAEIAREEGVEDVRVEDLPERDNEEALLAALADRDVVGFSSICSTYNQTIRLCRKLKAASPDTLILLGGPQASLTGDSSLAAFDVVDILFEGEAEISWRTFLKLWAAGGDLRGETPGIAWKENGVIRRTPAADIVWELDKLPMPAFDLYDISHRTWVTPVEIGRGCPFACSFCATSPFFRRRFRLKPVERILAEMDLLNDLYGCDTFYLVQDSFSNKRSFVEEVCRALREHSRRYEWYCSARTDQVDEALLKEMKRSGCGWVYYGLETGSQRMQKVINKRLDLARAVEVIRLTGALGLVPTASMIIGFPDETLDDLADTLRVFLHLKAMGIAMVQLHVLAPLPGSQLMREGHPMDYDGVASDFSDTGHVLDDEDRELVRRYGEVFTSFWYFVNREIPRQRFLLLARALFVASIYLPNALELAARRMPEALVRRLLTSPPPDDIPWDLSSEEALLGWLGWIAGWLEELVAEEADSQPLSWALAYDLAYSRAELEPYPMMKVLDLPAALGQKPGRRLREGFEAGGPLATFVIQRPEKVVQARRLNEETARRLRRDENAPGPQPEGDLEQLIAKTCGACGECCFDMGGILCGRDEWPAIHRNLGGNGSLPSPEPLAASDLVYLPRHRYLADCGSHKRLFDDLPSARDAADRDQGRVRRICPALAREDGAWRCTVEAVKPAGCIAYPLRLGLEAGQGGEVPWLALGFPEEPSHRPCPLEKELRQQPELLERYLERTRERIGQREGSFALADYNRSQRLASLSAPIEAGS